MKELLGGCLQAIGILIAGLFGICTLLMIGDVASWRNFTSAITNLIFLSLPIFFGLGLVWAGRALVRSGRQDRW